MGRARCRSTNTPGTTRRCRCSRATAPSPICNASSRMTAWSKARGEMIARFPRRGAAASRIHPLRRPRHCSALPIVRYYDSGPAERDHRAARGGGVISPTLTSFRSRTAAATSAPMRISSASSTRSIRYGLLNPGKMASFVREALIRRRRRASARRQRFDVAQLRLRRRHGRSGVGAAAARSPISLKTRSSSSELDRAEAAMIGGPRPASAGRWPCGAVVVDLDDLDIVIARQRRGLAQVEGLSGVRAGAGVRLDSRLSVSCASSAKARRLLSSMAIVSAILPICCAVPSTIAVAP